MGGGLCYYLNQQGPVSRETALKVLRKVGGIRDAYCWAAASFRNSPMIDVRETAGSREAAELDSFRITLEAKDTVVQHDDEYRKLAPHHGLQLRPAMRETAVPDDDNDRLVGLCHFRAERKWQAPPKSGKAPRR